MKVTVAISGINLTFGVDFFWKTPLAGGCVSTCCEQRGLVFEDVGYEWAMDVVYKWSMNASAKI